LLADPGDEVLIPAPGYPLFDQLAGFEGVGVRSYPSRRRSNGGFAFDLDAVREALGPRTRALLVVHPNNPTGARVSRTEAAQLRTLCRERKIALVVDEVFADFVLDDEPEALPSFLLGADDEDAPLTFVLSGISKSLALPQLKIAWIAVRGPIALREEALARLEVIADAYLSVTTPGQLMLPRLLRGRSAVQAELLERLRRNRSALTAALADAPAWRLLPVAAGWSAIVAVHDPTAPRDEDALVAQLLEQADLLVQPGWLFDLDGESERCAHLVISLLPEPTAFAAGMARLAAARKTGECGR
jgi:aspartate/methionine/tyrosine aminotransferase